MNHTTDYVFNQYSPVFIPLRQQRNELTSSTRIPDEQPEDNTINKKKKPCRGNRKEQHKRRRLRRHKQQEMNQSIIIEDIHDDRAQLSSINDDHSARKLENKRKRSDSKRVDSNVSRSMSQLSITKQTHPLKKQTTNLSDHQPPKNQPDDPKMFRPDYLKVSDIAFKNMLGNAIENGQELVACLNTEEKIQFVRRITETTNQFQYFDLQRQLWQEYENLGLKEGRWAPQVSKSYAVEHRTCHTYGYRQQIIKKRQRTIQYQLQRSATDLQTFIQALANSSKQWQPSLDANRLSEAIIRCVQKGQRRLREDFEYKKKKLQFDAEDHDLIRTFYRCGPNEEQISLAKKIWQTVSDELKVKEHEEILRKRIYLQRIPSEMDQKINQSVDSIEHLLGNPLVNADHRASLISACSKTTTQYKVDLMTIKLETIQTIRHGYQKLLVDLKTQLKHSCCNETIKQAIDQRQQALHERHEIYLKHKLNSFFDEAPMASLH